MGQPRTATALSVEKAPTRTGATPTWRGKLCVMIRGLALAVVIATAGCLDVPPPANTQDAQTSDARTNDARTNDAFVANCGGPSDFNGRSWPPGGMEIGIREIIAADVNADGNLDLILTNAEVSDNEDWGLFVMLGPQTDPSNLQYHAFVPTNVIPWSVAAVDLNGDQCAELISFGLNKAADAGLIDVYEQISQTHTWDPAIQKNVDGFLPIGDGAPVLITFGDFDGDGVSLDLAISDLTRLYVFHSLGATPLISLQTATATPVGRTGPPGTWTDINALFADPAANPATAANDLVVVEENGMTWLQNNGSGAFGSPFTSNSSGVFISRTAKRVDLDQTPPLDIIAGSGSDFGAYLLARNGTTIELQTRPWNGDVPTSNALNDVLVGNIGGTDLPEVVVIEADENMVAKGFAYLVDGVSSGATQLSPSIGSAFDFPGEHMTTGVITDFNGDDDDEAWIFAPNGDVKCLQRNPGGPNLQVCQ